MFNRNSQSRSKERRKHKRFQLPQGVFVGIGPHFTKLGRLRDLNMGGLAFRYIGRGDSTNGSYVDIFMDEGHFFLGNVPIKVISDVEVVEKASFSSAALRRCAVKFKKLTRQQKAKLKEFIENHSVGKA